MKRYALLPIIFASSAAFAQSAVTQPNFQMPGGSGCSGELARYRAVSENDVAKGNVARSIYNQVKREIEAAEKACSAGEEAKATAMIRASESRHGYSTHL